MIQGEENNFMNSNSTIATKVQGLSYFSWVNGHSLE